MNIVIANSVGKDLNGNYFIHFPSRWTAKMGKTREFTFYPYGLAYLSSILKKETKHKIKMLDGNLLGLKPTEYIKLISKYKPDWLIMETASPVYRYDLEIAKNIKNKFNTRIIFCGQHPTAFPKEVIKDGADYVCLGEYEETVLDIISGKNKKEILGLYPNLMRPPLNVKNLPFPEDDDIKRINYDHIGGCDYREIEFFASRGCPFSCQFCVCGNLYYKHPNWRPREVSNIIIEIKYLKKKYPEMEGIFFDEEDHVINKQFTLKLCQAIIDNNLDKLHYNAMCGYGSLDEEMLVSLKKAGYYKLRIGIETASSKTAKIALKKNINIKKLKQVLKIAKKINIKMYGTFTFGAPGSTEQEDRKTLKLIKNLLAENLLYDFQRSICTPLPGTPYYIWAKENNYLISNNWDEYNGGTAVVNLPNYSKETIEKVYRECGQIFLKHQLKHHKIRLLIENIQKNGLPNTLRKVASTIAQLEF